MRLIDVADEVRRDRLAVRDAGRWDADAVDAFLGWAAWHRGHAQDPHRRTGWTAEDSRWCTHLLDTTGQPLAKSVDQVQRWVTEQRDAHRTGRLPLNDGWS